jgi:hypothetical protein
MKLERVTDKRTLQFIRILRRKGRTKSREMLEELGIKNPRSLTIYKNYANLLGYNIKSVCGYNGGYEIIEEKLTDNELDIIKNKLSKDLSSKIIRIMNRV